MAVKSPRASSNTSISVAVGAVLSEECGRSLQETDPQEAARPGSSPHRLALGFVWPSCVSPGPDPSLSSRLRAPNYGASTGCAFSARWRQILRTTRVCIRCVGLGDARSFLPVPELAHEHFDEELHKDPTSSSEHDGKVCSAASHLLL